MVFMVYRDNTGRGLEMNKLYKSLSDKIRKAGSYTGLLIFTRLESNNIYWTTDSGDFVFSNQEATAFASTLISVDRKGKEKTLESLRVATAWLEKQVSF